MILLPLMLQVGSVPEPSPLDKRYQSCLSLATNDPKSAEVEAARFGEAGGGARAKQCLGMAYAQEGRWREAGAAFEEAAHVADAAKDSLAARYWSQAGNAWLAAGDTAKAKAALDTAITSGALSDFERGEALLDRARTLVAAGQQASARADIDAALDDAPKDPLAWLLSATLARRMNDVLRAKGDIARALTLAADDASVQLEAGNIAALSGDRDGARNAWETAAKIAPGTPVGDYARKALVQFDQPAAPATPAPKSAMPPPAK